MKDIVRITLDLDQDRWQKIKIAAAKKRMHLKEITIQGIDMWLSKNQDIFT